MLWTNTLYCWIYWVSLGRFYLLNIHCDYFSYKPLCGVAQTLDCGMLVIYFISPLCGVAQTPDWGMLVIYYPFETSLQTSNRCILLLLCYYIFMLHINNLLACIRDFIFMTDVVIIECFQSMIIICYIIPVFIMFASTFKVLTGLSLAIVLARFLAWRGALRWQPRNLSNGDSSLAKIGVNLVSSSCGKWSPINTDVPQTAFSINHQKPFFVLIGHNGLVLHILYFAWNFCIKLVPHQLIVILGLVSTRAIFWKLISRKSSPDMRS